MTRYRLSRDARNDLIEIRQSLLDRAGKKVALHVLRRLRDGFDFLVAMPGAGHRRSDLTSEPVKFWPVFSYLIVYDAAIRPIGIARILHGSRDIEAIFRQRPPRM